MGSVAYKAQFEQAVGLTIVILAVQKFRRYVLNKVPRSASVWLASDFGRVENSITGQLPGQHHPP